MWPEATDRRWLAQPAGPGRREIVDQTGPEHQQETRRAHPIRPRRRPRSWRGRGSTPRRRSRARPRGRAGRARRGGSRRGAAPISSRGPRAPHRSIRGRTAFAMSQPCLPRWRKPRRFRYVGRCSRPSIGTSSTRRPALTASIVIAVSTPKPCASGRTASHRSGREGALAGQRLGRSEPASGPGSDGRRCVRRDRTLPRAPAAGRRSRGPPRRSVTTSTSRARLAAVAPRSPSASSHTSAGLEPPERALEGSALAASARASAAPSRPAAEASERGGVASSRRPRRRPRRRAAAERGDARTRSARPRRAPRRARRHVGSRERRERLRAVLHAVGAAGTRSRAAPRARARAPRPPSSGRGRRPSPCPRRRRIARARRTS